MAAPWIAATTGVCVLNRRPASPYSEAGPTTCGDGRMKSTPAQKCRPSEHRTLARHSGRPSTASYASASDRMSAMSKKLFGGRCSSMVATKSSPVITLTSPNRSLVIARLYSTSMSKSNGGGVSPAAHPAQPGAPRQPDRARPDVGQRPLGRARVVDVAAGEPPVGEVRQHRDQRAGRRARVDAAIGQPALLPAPDRLRDALDVLAAPEQPDPVDLGIDRRDLLDQRPHHAVGAIDLEVAPVRS